MFVKIKQLIFDPVKARIIYDYVICLATLVAISVLFTLFHNPGATITEYLLLPLTFVFFNSIFGIYTSKKMAAVITKSLLLLVSIGASCVYLYIMFHLVNLPLAISALIIALLSIMPRVFFNFPTAARQNVKIHTVIRANAPILVVGGGGYIGSLLVEKLLKKNYKVRVLDKFIYGREVLQQFEKNKNLEIVEGDVSNLYDVTYALNNVQAVIHLAGIVGDPAASLDPKLTRHMNIVSTRMLKETVKAFRIQKFIFASSCSVYGISKTLATETSKTRPVSFYAQSKVDSENELLRDTFDEFHPTILRFATVFGHSYRPRFDLVANLFTAHAFYEGKLNVMNPDQWRPFIHVSDVAEGIVKTLEAPVEKISRQIFNVGDDRLNLQIISLAELVKATIEQQRKVKIFVSTKEFDKRDYSVSFKKIHETLNFSASISIEEGIREMYEHLYNKTYKRSYKDPNYNNYLMTKKLMKEYNSQKYQHTHFSTIS